MSSSQLVNPCNLCGVEYGSHIGEYIRYKLDRLGISQAHLAKQITENGREMTRSNLNRILTNKAEFTPSEMALFSQGLPDDFFDEFYKHNPKLKGYQAAQEPVKPKNGEHSEPYQLRGSGYRITLEIDPVDFDPDMLDPLSESLKKALEDFHNRIKQDKKRTE